MLLIRLEIAIVISVANFDTRVALVTTYDVLVQHASSCSSE